MLKSVKKFISDSGYLRHRVSVIPGIIFIAIIIVLAIVYFFRTPSVVEATWWNDTWSYRQSIAVTNGSGGALTDFQVQILDDVSLTALNTAGKLQANLADLRFTDINHRILPYWIEDSTIGEVDAWVKIPSIPSAGTIIYMYYGNASATDAQSGEQTFEFFDDYSGDLTNYDQVGGDVWGTTGGYAHDETGVNLPGQRALIKSTVYQVNDNFMMKVRARQNDNDGAGVVFRSTGSTYYTCNHINEGTPRLLISENGGGHHTGTSLNATNYAFVQTNFYNIEVRVVGTSISCIADMSAGDVTVSATDASYSTGQMGLFAEYLDPYGEFDWLIIGKAVATMPVSTSPSSEENAPGPIMYLNFDEGFGTTAYDSTSYGNDGTLTNSPTWIQNGASGRALNFDSATEHVLVADTPEWDFGTGDLGISFWFKSSNAARQHALEFGASPNNLSFDFNDGGYGIWVYWMSGGTPNTRTTTYYNDDAWHHLVFTRGGTTANLYVDGVVKATTTDSTNIQVSGLIIGARTTSGTNQWLGSLDEIYVYDKVLEKEDVLQLYNMNAGSFSTGRSELPSSCMDQLAQNPDSRSGVYTIDPGPGVDPFDVYCDMETDGGGWTMVASNHSSSTTIPSGTGRNAAQYELDRNGSYSALGTPDPNTDYIIGAAIDILEWDEGRVTMYGYDSTSTSYLYPDNLGDYADVKWDIPGSGSSRRDQVVGVADVTIFRNSNYASFHASADYFYIDGVRHDYIPDSVYGANSNQATVGGVGRSGTTDTGTYFGHGSSEGSYEGAYNAAGTSKNSSGYITWVRSNTTTVSPGVALDLPFENVSGSTTYDISGNGNDGAISGATHKTSANCKVGKCFDFNGTSSDFIQTTITGTYDQITFSFWGYFDDPTLDVYSRNESAFGDWTSSRVHFGTRWSVGIHWNVNSSWTEIPSTNIVYGWNHYGLVYNTDTSEKLVYINGKLALSDTTNGAMVIGDFKIGNATSLNQYYRGKLDEFKIFNRALTQREIMMEMNSGKHQPVLDLGFDEGGGDTAYDKSGFANNGDLYGTCPGDATCPTWKTAENCVNGSCLSFDGGDYINAGTVGGYTNKLTTMAWVKRTTGATSWNDIISGITGDILFSINTDKVVLGAQGNTPIQHDTYSTTLINDNIWHHVVGTYDGSTIRIYVDGILENSASKSGNYTAGNLKLGSNNAGTSEFFNGSIDGLKVYNYTLTAQEIKQEYAQSAGQFGRTNSVGDKTTPGASCMDILQKNPKSVSGKYWVDPSGGSQSDVLEVYCDMEYDGGGWTLLGLEFAYTNSSWLPFNTYGDISANGANLNNLITSGTSSNYMYMQKVLASDYTFDEFWAGKLNSANLTDKDVDTQIQITLSGQSWPPNAKTGATNVYTNTWCSSWRYGDATNGFELWLGEALACGAYSATTGNIPRRIYKSGTKLSWNGNNDTGTSTDNNFGYLFGRNFSVTPNSTGPLLDMDFDQYVGGVYLDRSGNGATGTSSGSPIWKTTVNCKSGRCVNMASTDYINWGGSIDNGTTTVVTWFKSTYTDKQMLFGFRGTNAQGGFHFDWSVDRPLLYLNGSNYLYWGAEAVNYMDGNWHFLEMYLPGSGQTDVLNAVLRIDNTVISKPGASSTGTVQGTWDNFHIGNSTSGFRGSVDEMKVFNRELTRAEIAQLYNGGQPVGWWRLDEGVDNLCSDGKDVCDNSGEGNNGTLSGDPVWTASTSCKQGGCMDFDGSSDYIDITHGGDLSFTTELSVSTWFKHDTVVGSDSMVTRLGTGGSDNFNLYFSSADLTFGMRDSGCSTWQSINLALSDVSTWHHAMATYDGSYSRLYLDGELEDTSASAFSVCTSPISNMRIGAGAVFIIY